MSDFVKTTDDNGGVHINSGIPNHAFFLLVEGLSSGGIGLADARSIFYRALTTKLNANSNFIDMRLACVLSAEELLGSGSTQATKTGQVFNAVEIFDPITPPVLPGDLTAVTGTDSYLFSYLAVDSNYYLGRREAAFGDGSGVTNISVNPMSTETKPSVTGDGAEVYFVTSTYDIAAVNTNGTRDDLAGAPGYFNSVAISPDGSTAAAIMRDPSTGLADQSIYLAYSDDSSEILDLYLPVIDGPNSIELTSVDEIDFTPSGQLLIFDGLARTTLGDGSTIEGWAIFAVDLNTKDIYRILGPVAGLNIGNPASSTTGVLRITFEVDDNGDLDLYNWDLFNNISAQFDTISSYIYFAYPRYSAADNFVTYTEDYFSLSDFSYYPEVRKQALQPDHINPSGFSSSLGAIFATGLSYRRGTFNGAPTISVTALTPSVEGGETGTFRIVRVSGDSSVDVPVDYKAIGTATPGIDYNPINLQAVIPASSSYVDVSVNATLTPDDDAQTLVLSLDSKYHYQLFSNGKEATMNLTPPAMTYSYYATQNSLGPQTEDDDEDNISNIIEYALGLDATTYNALQLEAEMPTIGLDTFLQMTVQRNLDRSGITWELERSANLSTWEDANTAIVNSSETEITLRDTLPIGNDTRRFIRLKVSEN